MEILADFDSTAATDSFSQTNKILKQSEKTLNKMNDSLREYATAIRTTNVIVNQSKALLHELGNQQGIVFKADGQDGKS
ncbi:MAG TPA: hypothetical protein VGD40_08755 [Chryseosolibacter sp.]